MINRFLRAGYVKKYSLLSLRVILNGGAILKPKIQEELKRLLPHVHILQFYGKNFGATKLEIRYFGISKTIKSIAMRLVHLFRNDGNGRIRDDTNPTSQKRVLWNCTSQCAIKGYRPEKRKDRGTKSTRRIMYTVDHYDEWLLQKS